MAKKSIIYPEIENIFDDNPLISKEEVLDLMLKSGLSKNKQPKQTYNRAIKKVFTDRGGNIETRLAKDVVIESFDGQSNISDEEFARDDFIDSLDEDEDEIIWYKKLLKTGKTTKPRTGKTSEQIEVITYEDNDDDRMQELLDGALENIDELEYIDELGYTSTPVKTLDVDNLYIFRSALLLIGLKKKTIQI